MQRLYNRLKTAAANTWHWYADYCYVALWRIHDKVFKADIARYKNGRSDKPAVILLPGIYEHWQFMKPLADSIDGVGYRLYIVEQLGYNAHSVEVSAAVVERYIQTAGVGDYVIVAHSKGGLIGKYVMAREAGAHCKGMIAINTPFNGSLYAKLFLMGPLKMFSPNSKTIQYLRSQRALNKKIVSIYGLFDPHIPGGSKLAGATNMQLPVRGHFKVISHPKVKAAVLQQLTRLAA